MNWTRLCLLGWQQQHILWLIDAEIQVIPSGSPTLSVYLLKYMNK